jgi:hypothetical protein
VKKAGCTDHVGIVTILVDCPPVRQPFSAPAGDPQ